MSTIGIYRAYDGADRLLYVGSSVDIDARLRQHESAFPAWWAFQRRIDVQTFSTEEQAREAEARAIAAEHPRWNVTGRSPDHPDGFAGNAASMSWLATERDIARHLKRLTSEARQLKARYQIAARECRMYESMAEAISDGTINFEIEDIA